MNGRIRDHIVSMVEKSVIAELLKLTRGNQTKVAEALGVNRGTLRRKLHRYGFI
jgi:Fis family transcriptional regulator